MAPDSSRNESVGKGSESSRSDWAGKDWQEIAAKSVLRRAVSAWRADESVWFERSFERLKESVRVNPLRDDAEWVEEWLESSGAKRIEWFSGVGSAWEFSFVRGKAEGEVRTILSALHETGRLTRQEAVSMIPAIALDAQPGEIILDMCASPGSKTTQIAEHLGDSGVVMGNEVVNGRINTLVANAIRHSALSTMVVHHDGRSIPRVPNAGFDRILVDAPCTGSATTRKNPDVWKKWKPSGGRSLQRLQIDLLRRALDLVKSGGRVVYSTCSLDPVENEAVVAEILRTVEGIRLLPAKEMLPLVPSAPGFSEWPALNDEGEIVDGIGLESSILPPKEAEIAEQLPQCMRIWNDAIDAGGFFVAVLEKNPDNIRKTPHVEQVLNPEAVKADDSVFPQPASEEDIEAIQLAYGWCPDDLWKRGKSLLWATPEAREIWRSERFRRSGRTLVPGGRWRPLRVIHLGKTAVRMRKQDVDRITGRCAESFAPKMQRGLTKVDSRWIDALLGGEEPPAWEILAELDSHRGGHILTENESNTAIPVWIGGRVTLMISEPERRVLRAKRGLAILPKTEEE